MINKITIPVIDVTPSLDAVLGLQGIPQGAEIESRVLEMAKVAIQLYTDLARPVGIIREISRTDFEPIYDGIGLNDTSAPIKNIYRKARLLALFAATVGPGIGEKTSKLFSQGEFALGSLLDSAASNGTDLIARALEDRFNSELIRLNRATDQTVILAYSPGYCGWHISAQKGLFDYLHPENIGISLRDSFLMEPLKSISGVLLAGPKEIHIFDNDYSFCGQCKSPSCLDRIKSLEAK